MSKRGQILRLCLMTTAPVSLYGLHRGLFPYLRDKGWHVTGISGPGDQYHHLVREQDVPTIEMPLTRQPAPLKDLWCLARLWWYLLWHRFDIVHVSTPKAALLGMLAAWLSGHRRRVYTARGRAYENYHGFKRKTFTAMEWVVGHLASRVIPICRELGDALVAEGACPRKKIAFLGASSNGVDSVRFSRSPRAIQDGQEIRTRLGIHSHGLVILFVGRIRRDKGVNELVRAFNVLRSSTNQQVHLVLLGPAEPEDPLDAEVEATINSNPLIHAPGNSNDTVPYYAMADIAVLPSYREGFGNVLIEASAMELPVVASDIMGCREAVLNDYTGLLTPPMTVEPLAAALQRLLDDPALRQRLGHAGRERVINDFQPQQRWDGILRIYRELLDRCA